MGEAKRNRRKVVVIGAGALVLLLVAAYFLAINITKITGKTIDEGFGDANPCFAAKKVILYGAEGCSQCVEQKRLIRDNLNSITYVDCDTDISACSHLDRVPAWEVNNKVIFGVLSPSELTSFVEC